MVKRERDAHLNVMPPTQGFQCDLSSKKYMQIPGMHQKEQVITLKEESMAHSLACRGSYMDRTSVTVYCKPAQLNCTSVRIT